MRHSLMNCASTKNVDLCRQPSVNQGYSINIHTIYCMLMQVSFVNTTTRLQEEFSLPLPFLLKPSCYAYKLISVHIVKHDHVCSSIDGFVSFLLVPNFNIQKEGETP